MIIVISSLRRQMQDIRKCAQQGWRPRYSLDELLARVTPENMQGEIDWGAPVGREWLSPEWEADTQNDFPVEPDA